MARRSAADSGLTCGQPVDEQPVALVGGHPAGAGVRLGDVALLLQHGHVVAHGRAGDAEVVPLDDRSWSRPAPGWPRSRRRSRAGPRTVCRPCSTCDHLPFSIIAGSGVPNLVGRPPLPCAKCRCTSSVGPADRPAAEPAQALLWWPRRARQTRADAGDDLQRWRGAALPRARPVDAGLGPDPAAADPDGRAGHHQAELRLDGLLAEDSTFYGDLFPHAVLWEGQIYLEDGLHRAVRAALRNRAVLHARVFDYDECPASSRPEQVARARSVDGRRRSAPAGPHRRPAAGRGRSARPVPPRRPAVRRPPGCGARGRSVGVEHGQRQPVDQPQRAA